jgi:ubiquinone/menaquinone biosynthesis C-methylase UbiE
MPSDKSVREFWDEQAQAYGADQRASAPDHFYRDGVEIKRIMEVLEMMEPESILDIGCGNGYSTIKIAKAFPTAMVIGIDFSEKMLEEARKAASGVHNISFFEGDALSISRHPKLQHQKFDVVLSERCLINLANWEEQKLSILQMRKLLTPDGSMILIENTQEGLEKLNMLRDIVGLPPIKTRWHNFYIPEDKLKQFFAENGGKLFKLMAMENIGNLYYIISRVVYAKLAQMEGKEPSYDNPINEIASKLPNLGDQYSCSPNYMMILENIPDEK